MDSLTHIVVGACIGELIAGKKLGKKAMMLGALANSLPDIDVVASLWLSTTSDLLAHRGFTHSLLFALLVSPLLAFLCRSIFRKQNVALTTWVGFWGIQILCHLFIDSCNAYGTGLFEPFSHYRVAFNTMFVADPLFTLWPIFAFVFLLIAGTGNRKRRAVSKVALVLSGLYLLSGVGYKLYINSLLQSDIERKGLVFRNYFTTPTPLNNLLWYIVGESDSGFYIGYRSVLDKPKPIQYHFSYKNDSLLTSSGNDKDLQLLKRFSKGYYTAQLWHDTLVFNDLRFGEIAGWSDPHPRCIFYYFLQLPSENDLIVQRGRFAMWNKKQFMAFVNRIKGI